MSDNITKTNQIELTETLLNQLNHTYSAIIKLRDDYKDRLTQLENAVVDVASDIEKAKGELEVLYKIKYNTVRGTL